MEATRGTPLADEGDVLIHFLQNIPALRALPQQSLLILAQVFTVGIFALSSYLFVTNPDGATLIERPTQSVAIGLILSGFAIISIHLVLRSKVGSLASKKDYIPLTELDGALRGSVESLAQPSQPGAARHLPLLLIAAAIVLRVNAFEQVLRNIRCASPGTEAFLPMAVVVFEAIRRIMKGLKAAPAETGFASALGSATLLTWGNAVAARMAAYPLSSTICPADSGIPRWTVLMQIFGVLLDAWLLQSLREVIVTMKNQRPSKLNNAPLFLAILFILSAVALLSVGLLSAIIPSYRGILSNLSGRYLSHVIWACILFVPINFCAIRLFAYGGWLDIAAILSIIVSSVNIMNGKRNLQLSLTPAFFFPTIPPFLFLLLGSCLYFASSSSSKLQTRPSTALLPILLLLFFAFTFSWSPIGGLGNQQFATHPIDALMQQAEAHYSQWAKQAYQSQSLETAVQEYVRRYGRPPPPGFDKWYEFATKKKSIVIDDFDSIDENLRPFWKLSPGHIRERTNLLLSDEKNDCAEVSIRSGNATVGRVVPTHRWMVDGVIKMMEPFMDQLPDMDIAFNINDEPRVSVPFYKLRNLQHVPVWPEAKTLSNSWSEDRAKTWESIDISKLSPLVMEMHSFRKIWIGYGSVACPPDSPARKTQFWQSSTLCTECYVHHCTGPFLSNWTYAADPCHQPDLALLHGFYLSPSAFKATHELIPIFSQSRAGGFSDILYPSAWNYNDKVKYEPSDEFPDARWAEKENAIFWRGGSTEGFSLNGAWKNSARQRLVNAANNSTLRSEVLLPSQSGFAYASMSADEFVESSLIKPMKYKNDLGFVATGNEKFPRCDNGDCGAQYRHFGVVDGTDFQYHWKNRYLLDADGAGFSGRFLAFLQSHSLPVKTAIFREWYDSRVIPWKHFVPVDIRLHGLWSTMAYFATAGFGGRPEGKDPGEEIAEAGREWAGKVLRKEDMEIYFYRLLLEYGRLTDDRRDVIGYTGPS